MGDKGDAMNDRMASWIDHSKERSISVLDIVSQSVDWMEGQLAAGNGYLCLPTLFTAIEVLGSTKEKGLFGNPGTGMVHERMKAGLGLLGLPDLYSIRNAAAHNFIFGGKNDFVTSENQKILWDSYSR
jgi:hypothetical protein